MIKDRDMKNVKEIIEAVSKVDGETMQHILEEAGMELQMLRQLIMTAPAGLVESLVEERDYLQLDSVVVKPYSR